MRTNIVLDDALVEEAMRVTGERTKTGVVHRALRELIRVTGLRRLRENRNLTSWEGDLDAMRERQPALVREARGSALAQGASTDKTYGTARRHKRTR
jgi:Arc/MetJ family transcription regulator